MAYVQMPKDLEKIKTKIIFNLTKRQLICFSAAMIVGYIFYRLTEDFNQDIRLYLMMAVISPFAIAGIYEKNGVSFENYLKYRYETEIKHPKMRIYKSKNLYIELIEQGDDNPYGETKTSKKTTRETSKGIKLSKTE